MSTPQTVFFHIGIGKTGSSYIQSSLAAAADDLKSQDLFYPIRKADAKAGARGYVSSGNFNAGAGPDRILQEFPEVVEFPKVLFSNETIHLPFSDPRNALKNKIRSAFPDARLEFLCFIRDPVEHAISAYQQAVKRGGYTGTCGDFLRHYDRPLGFVNVAQSIKDIGGTLTIRNYSRHKKDLLPLVESWLGLSRGTLPKPPIERVNRSLTLSELELQRAFNRVLGSGAFHLVSDPLCNFLPDLKSEIPTVSRGEMEHFLARMKKVIADPRLVALIPPEEYYQLDDLSAYEERYVAEPEAEQELRFDADQIAVLSQAISKALTTGKMDRFFRKATE